MAYTFEEIVGIVRQRQDIQSPLLSKMIDIKDRYNGDYVIPLPSMDEEPVLPPLTPALISENIDAVAQRAASVTPYIGCPAVDPSKERGKRSRQYADIRKRALAATWYQNKYKLKMRRAYRHLAGYATTALVVNPDFKTGMPKIEVRDPLGVYPEPSAAENYDIPRNCAFVYGKSGDWLRANYPASRDENGGPIASDKNARQELWDCCEWIDEEHIVIGIMGPRYNHFNQTYPYHSTQLELSRYENLAGMPCVITPGRVTLDKISSGELVAIELTDKEYQFSGDIRVFRKENKTFGPVAQFIWQALAQE